MRSQLWPVASVCATANAAVAGNAAAATGCCAIAVAAESGRRDQRRAEAGGGRGEVQLAAVELMGGDPLRVVGGGKDRQPEARSARPCSAIAATLGVVR